MPKNILYEKGPYVVLIKKFDMEYQGSTYTEGYEVVNKETGVTEYRCPCLADCVSMACSAANALDMYKQGAEELVNVDIMSEGETMQ